MRIFQVCLSTRPPNLRIEDPSGHDLASANGRTLDGEADETSRQVVVQLGHDLHEVVPEQVVAIIRNAE
jgi:hypothetical protein